MRYRGAAGGSVHNAPELTAECDVELQLRVNSPPWRAGAAGLALVPEACKTPDQPRPPDAHHAWTFCSSPCGGTDLALGAEARHSHQTHVTLGPQASAASQWQPRASRKTDGDGANGRPALAARPLPATEQGASGGGPGGPVARRPALGAPTTVANQRLRVKSA